MIDISSYQISNLVTTDIISVKPDELMPTVCDVFDNHNFHHVPVIDDNNNCVGVISQKDYLQLQDKFSKWGYKSADINNRVFFRSLLAKDVMTEEVISLEHDQMLSEAIQIFEKNKVRSIIVTKEGKFFGILTPIDLFVLFK